MLCPQESCLSYFRKKLNILECWSVNDQSGFFLFAEKLCISGLRQIAVTRAVYPLVWETYTGCQFNYVPKHDGCHSGLSRREPPSATNLYSVSPLQFNLHYSVEEYQICYKFLSDADLQMLIELVVLRDTVKWTLCSSGNWTKFRFRGDFVLL